MLTASLIKPIANLDQAKAWIEELAKSGLCFHFEDAPETVGNMRSGQWVDLFTKDEAATLRARVRELYALDWSKEVDGEGQPLECPIGYALVMLDKYPERN